MRPSSTRVLWAAGLLAAAILFSQTLDRVDRPGGIDLTTYLAAARALGRGDNPYTLDVPFPYLYPAFLALLLMPLAALPEGVVLVLWFAASVAALVWAVRSMTLAAAPAMRSHQLTPFLALLFAGAFPIVQSNLRNGQVNFFVVALCVLAAGGAASVRAGVVGRAVAWGAAVAVKIVPAVLGVFYLLRRRWGELAGGLAVVTVLFIVPAIAAGRAVVAQQQTFLAGLIGHGFVAASGLEPLDFSAGGMLIRLQVPLPVVWLRVLGAVGVVAVAAIADWRARTATTEAHAAALYLAAVPLASPKSEVHHLAFALPAVTVIAAQLWVGVASRRARLLFVATVGCYGMAMALRPTAGVALFLSLAILLAALVEVGVRPRLRPDSRH